MQNDIPVNPENFSILVQAIIGPVNGKGEESFDFKVCTPNALIDFIEKDGFFFGRGYLIVKYYSYKQIFHIIDSLCKRISGGTWNEVGEKLGRFGHWEFEDYQERKDNFDDI
jgi:hypothetical protein